MKRSKAIRVRTRMQNVVRNGGGASWRLDCLEPRLLLSTVTVWPALAAEGNGTTNATLTARLDVASRSNVILQYSTYNGTAKGGLDYAPTASFVVIPAGATSATFTIPILANNVYQGLTSFGVNLVVSGGNKLALRQTAVYIVDNDAPPRVGIVDVTLPAGSNAETAYVPLTLSSVPLQPVTVSYTTVNGTALAGTDYRATCGTITFQPGETFKTIPVQMMVGTAGDKAFEVVVGSARNGSLSSLWEYGRVAIQKGAAATKPTVAVWNASAVAGGFEQFHVSLSRATTKAVSLRFHSYPPTSGGAAITPADGILTIPAGSTTGTIWVATQAGNGSANASFALSLTAPANANLANPVAWGAIISAPPTLSVSDASRLEGDSGTSPMVFTVTLSRTSTQTVTVDYATADVRGVAAVPGAAGDDPVAGRPYPFARAGTDYVAAGGTLTFAPGETSQTISVLVNGDTTVEPDEPFDLNLSNASHATLARAAAVGTILNDDVGSLSIAPASVTEEVGNLTTQTLTYTVTLSQVTPVTVTVHYATSDVTAAAGTDYTATSGTLTFTPGETSQTIDVTVTGDSSPAANTLKMTLSNVTNATIGTSVGVGTINYTDLVLSDNLSETVAGQTILLGGRPYAASFSTGSSSVSLTSVTIPFREILSGTLTMMIYSDNSGMPGTLAGTLTSPFSYASSITNTEFTTSGILLAANTTYWVVLQSPSGIYGWATTTSSSGTGTGFTGVSDVSLDGGSSWLGNPTLEMQVLAST